MGHSFKVETVSNCIDLYTEFLAVTEATEKNGYSPVYTRTVSCPNAIEDSAALPGSFDPIKLGSP